MKWRIVSASQDFLTAIELVFSALCFLFSGIPFELKEEPEFGFLFFYRTGILDVNKVCFFFAFEINNIYFFIPCVPGSYFKPTGYFTKATKIGGIFNPSECTLLI